MEFVSEQALPASVPVPTVHGTERWNEWLMVQEMVMNYHVCIHVITTTTFFNDVNSIHIQGVPASVSSAAFLHITSAPRPCPRRSLVRPSQINPSPLASRPPSPCATINHPPLYHHPPYLHSSHSRRLLLRPSPTSLQSLTLLPSFFPTYSFPISPPHPVSPPKTIPPPSSTTHPHIPTSVPELP